MKILRAICAVLLVLSLWSGFPAGAVAAENRYAMAGIENPAEFEAAFLAFQKALSANDRSKVSEFILYPLRVNGWIGEPTGKTTVQLANRQELLENYDEIFTVQIREAVLKQKPADLFVNWQGVMVGKGEVWLGASGGRPVRYGVIAVNLSI